MYCYHINLDIKPLKFDLDLLAASPAGKPKTNYAETFTLDCINPELVNFLDQRNIKVGWVEIFHKYTGMSTWEQIHVDESKGDFVKLNWVWGGSDSYMCWFKEKNNINKTTNYNEIAGAYIGYNINEVDLVHREHLQGPCVIQAGVPHNIIMGKEHRHALSMVLLDTTSPVRRRLDMQSSVTALNDIICR